MPCGFARTWCSFHEENAVEVPFDPAERWNAEARSLRPGRRGFAVAASIDDCRFASHVVAHSKKFWLLLPPLVAVATNVKVGDEVDVWNTSRHGCVKSAGNVRRLW